MSCFWIGLAVGGLILLAGFLPRDEENNNEDTSAEIDDGEED